MHSLVCLLGGWPSPYWATNLDGPMLIGTVVFTLSSAYRALAYGHSLARPLHPNWPIDSISVSVCALDACTWNCRPSEDAFQDKLQVVRAGNPNKSDIRTILRVFMERWFRSSIMAARSIDGWMASRLCSNQSVSLTGHQNGISSKLFTLEV